MALRTAGQEWGQSATTETLSQVEQQCEGNDSLHRFSPRVRYLLIRGNTP
jgi:hypothetical protein